MGQGERKGRKIGDIAVRIDRTLCVGFGDCITTAPEAFALDEEDVAVFKDPDSVPRWRLLEACAACPVDAITVEDQDGNQLVP